MARRSGLLPVSRLRQRLVAACRPLLLAGAWLLFLACGGEAEHSDVEADPERSQAPSGEFLRVAIPATPVVVDALAPERPFQLSLVPYLYPSLLTITFDRAGNPRVRGDVASRWTWHPEERRLDLELGHRAWSDGRPIQEADVIESFRAHRSRSGADAPGSRLLEVTSPHPGNVSLRFAEDVPEWRALSIASLPIFVPEAKDGSASRAARSEPALLGGQLRIEERDSRRIELLPIENGPRPLTLPGVVVEVVAGGDTRLLRVAAGLSDVALDVPISRIGSLDIDDAVVLRDAGPGSVEMLCWNLRIAAFTPRLREAVSLAIDRARMARIFCVEDTCFGGPANGFLDPRAEPVGPDRARAAELLGSDSLPVVHMLYDRSNEVRERLATYLEEDLARVGIELRPIALDGPEVLRRYRSGEFETALLGFVPSAIPDCSGLWGSGGLWNGTGFRDARVDSLCREAQCAESLAGARELMLRIEERIRREMPVTFLVHRRRIDAISPLVNGFAGSTWQPLGPLEEVRRLRGPLAESRMIGATAREDAR